MRRWVCVIALLFGFAGDRYVWTIRPRLPVSIERTWHPVADPHALQPTGDWWRLA